MKIDARLLLSCALAALAGCASYYVDFDQRLNSAIGKTNLQIQDLPFDQQLSSTELASGERVVDYAFFRSGMCKWRFFYSKDGHIRKWEYPDEISRYQCHHMARSRP